jgi:ribosomal protein S18 acetylase RimI-like enzyme
MRLKKRQNMDQYAALDNPVWNALSSTHAVLAQAAGALKRYAPGDAPFCAVADVHAQLDAKAVPGGTVMYFVGAIPAMPAGWTAVPRGPVLQMVYEGERVAPPADAGIIKLGEPDVPDMLALTDLVYPEYFRPGNSRLGQYVGVRDQGQLVAMAGIRFCPAGFRELSAICTHPSQLGRGHARHLMAWLIDFIMGQGDQPILHVGGANARAVGLYERMGFRIRCEVPHCRVTVA